MLEQSAADESYGNNGCIRKRERPGGSHSRTPQSGGRRGRPEVTERCSDYTCHNPKQVQRNDHTFIPTLIRDTSYDLRNACCRCRKRGKLATILANFGVVLIVNTKRNTVATAVAIIPLLIQSFCFVYRGNGRMQMSEARNDHRGRGWKKSRGACFNFF